MHLRREATRDSSCCLSTNLLLPIYPLIPLVPCPHGRFLAEVTIPLDMSPSEVRSRGLRCVHGVTAVVARRGNARERAGGASEKDFSRLLFSPLLPSPSPPPSHSPPLLSPPTLYPSFLSSPLLYSPLFLLSPKVMRGESPYVCSERGTEFRPDRRALVSEPPC